MTNLARIGLIFKDKECYGVKAMQNKPLRRVRVVANKLVAA